MATRKIFFLFSILLSMVGIKAWAYDLAVENADGVTIFYNYVNDGKELSVTFEDGDIYNPDYISSSYSGTIVIPEEVTFMNRTRKVVSIGSYAFASSSYYYHKERSITSIVMPKSITRIEKGAFFCCDKIKSINIPDGVTSIGEDAFLSCKSLISISIPNLVTTIEKQTFFCCESLTSIIIPNSVTRINERAFYHCTNLVSITLPNSVKAIDNCAFEDCTSLTSIDLGNGLTSIGSEAFNYVTKMESIVLPKSLQDIGYGAFSDNDFVSIISLIEEPFSISGKNEYGMPFSKNTFNNATLYVPKGTIDKYKATNGWKDFLFIEEGTPTNIHNIESDKTIEIQRYTLDGKLVKNPQKGINIIQMNNGTTKKVVVR